MLTSRLAIQTTGFILEVQLGLVGFNGGRGKISLAQEWDRGGCREERRSWKGISIRCPCFLFAFPEALVKMCGEKGECGREDML